MYCYTCDMCGDEYYFNDAYDKYYSDYYKEMVYIIQGWYGEYDGIMMCYGCYDSY